MLSPVHQCRFFCLWAINAPLERALLQRQLDSFRAAGLDGVVFHPRFYPNAPPYLSDTYLAIVSETILYAKSIGLRFWLYDENGWPSGTAGGQLLERYPQDAQRWLELVRQRPPSCVADFEYNGTRWFLSERIGTGVDYLNKEVTRHFIELTHERYRTGLAAEAFEHVEAFFCDEPEFGLGHSFASLPRDGAIPWTPQLPALYRDRFGEELEPLLPLLFFSGPRHGELRIRFWEFVSELLCSAFLKPLNDWCAAQGKRFTAHVKGEEHPLFQVPMVGSSHKVYQQLSLPAIDALGRDPANDFFPRQVSAAAWQFGDGRCMVEAWGGSGWGGTPEDLERYLLWLGRNGLTDFVMHLAQYRLDSSAIHDWPPSQPLHLTWREAYPEVLRRVREKLSALSPPAVETLVVTPHRGIMAAFEPRELLQFNIHDAATYSDTLAGRMNTRFLALVKDLNERGIAHHFVDELTFENAVFEEESVRIGKCAYRHVIVADGAELPESSQLKARGLSYPPASSRIATRQLHFTQDKRTIIWTLAKGQQNHLVLETHPTSAAEKWRANFRCETVPDQLHLCFADEIAAVEVNGIPRPAQQTADSGTMVVLNSAQLGETNEVTFQVTGTHPFIWLEGCFTVRSESPFSPGPNHTIQTNGPFILSASDRDVVMEGPLDLISKGYPFARGPLLLEGLLVCPTAMEDRFLQLLQIEADAARVWIDENEAGFAYGPDWEVTPPEKLKAGPHRIRLGLIPSGYNFYGPHRHLDGDRHLVSPAQFSGRKNFADLPDSPDFTLGCAWHFKPLRAPRQLALSKTTTG